MNTDGLLRKLRTEARVAAEKHGHMITRFTMTRFGIEDGQYAYVGSTQCTVCGAQARFRTHPEPGQKQIGGMATIADCPPRR